MPTSSPDPDDLPADPFLEDEGDRPRVTPAGIALLAVILVFTLGFIGYSLLRDNPEEANAAKVPPVAAGLTALGSDLQAVDGVAPAGCDGEPPTATSPSCSVSQAKLSRRTTTVPQDGVIRAWTVRGAVGELSLQVLRTSGGKTSEVGRSEVERAPSTGPHRFETALVTKAGDQIGLVLASGAAIGMRPRPQSVTANWAAPVGTSPTAGVLGPRRELMLRTEFEPGAAN